MAMKAKKLNDLQKQLSAYDSSIKQIEADIAAARQKQAELDALKIEARKEISDLLQKKKLDIASDFHSVGAFSDLGQIKFFVANQSGYKVNLYFTDIGKLIADLELLKKKVEGL